MEIPYKTPLPNPQFYILLCVRFVEPIAFTLLFPFVYFMVKDFNVTDDISMVSYYAGLISSCYAAGEFLGAVPWGMLSDRIGRKPVITMGLLGTSITLFLFGLSTSLPWAMATRFLGGIVNGNVGVIKSMVGEMTDRTNRGDAFSYVSMMFGLGGIVGPMLGGFLTHPAENYPWLFGNSQFLKAYPYFLPCGVTAAFCLVGFFFAHFFLYETLERTTPSSPSAITPLLEEGLVESEPKNNGITKGTWLVILSYMGVSLFSVIEQELFPFWSSTPISKGGLSFEPKDIGTLGSLNGIVLILIQLFVYGRVRERVGTLNLILAAYLCFIPLFLCVPLVRTVLLEAGPSVAYASLLLLNFFKIFCSVAILTGINIIQPESCPDKTILGKINGITNSLGSLMRGIGPYMCGAVYSWSLSNNLAFPFDYHFTFFMIAAMSLATFFITKPITPAMLSY